MSKLTLTQELAHMAVTLKYEDMSQEQIQFIKTHLLDYLGCAYGGVRADSSQTVTRALMRFAEADAPSSVMGQMQKHSPTMAALINGTVAHAMEADDFHAAAAVEPAVVIFPALLAVGEWKKSSAKDIIAAALAGYEVMIRIGLGFLGHAQYAGWHLSGVCGVFGAAVAVGKLLGLDEQGLTKAMGIAGSTASGLLQFTDNGAWTKRLQAGNAASNGIIAAMLAGKGYTGPLTVLEGEYGIFKAYSYQGQKSYEPIIEQLGQTYRTMETALRPYPCSRLAHSAIDAALALTEEHDLQAADISNITVYTNGAAVQLLSTPPERKVKPETTVDAQFSLPYAVAVAVACRHAGYKEFTDPQVLADTQVTELASKVKCEKGAGQEAKYPQTYAASVHIETSGGQVYSSEVNVPKGEAANPLSQEEVLYKYRFLAAKYVKRPDWIENTLTAVKQLEEYADISDFVTLL